MPISHGGYGFALHSDEILHSRAGLPVGFGERLNMNASYRLLRVYTAPIVLLLTLVLAAVHTQNAFAQKDCGLNPLIGPVGPTGCDVYFGSSTEYTDDGRETLVAMNSAGLVVEAHVGGDLAHDIWYRLGKLDATSRTIHWGSDRKAEAKGAWPAVALGENGYVYLMYSDAIFRSASRQYYRVGTLNPQGDQNQQIAWKTDKFPVSGDRGFHASLSVWGNLLVGTYETSDSNTCSYAIGTPNNPGAGDFGIHWYTGAGNKRTISGLKCVNPHIGVVGGGRYGQGQIVLVYDVDGSRIVYERGSIESSPDNGGKGKQMYWETGAQDVATDIGLQPALALLPNGFAIEVHQLKSNEDLRSTVGKVDLSNPGALIDWAASKSFYPPDRGTYPALTSNGAFAVEMNKRNVGEDPVLWYSVSPIQ
jgi:hypothetical protein